MIRSSSKALAGLVCLAAFVLACASPAEARGGGRSYRAKGGTVSVRGHVTKNGTYVAPSHRTAPNKSKLDNWSTKGNVNPYTGKGGTQNP